MTAIKRISKDKLKPDSLQHRTISKTPEAIKNKKEQMEKEGQLTPIRISPEIELDDEIFHVIIDGEMRWLAACDSNDEKLQELDAIVDDSINVSDIIKTKSGYSFKDEIRDNVIIKQMLSNDDGSIVQDVIEKANAYFEIKVLMAKKGNKDVNEITNEILAKRLGKDETAIYRILSMRELPEKTSNFTKTAKNRDPRCFEALAAIERKAPSKIDEALEEMKDFEVKKEDGEVTGTARDFANKLKKKYIVELPKNKKKEKLPKPVGIKNIVVTRAGNKEVLQIDRARAKDTMRYILTDELKSQLKSMLDIDYKTTEQENSTENEVED